MHPSPLPHPSVPVLYGCHTVVPVNRQGKPGIFWDGCFSFWLNVVPLGFFYFHDVSPCKPEYNSTLCQQIQMDSSFEFCSLMLCKSFWNLGWEPCHCFFSSSVEFQLCWTDIRCLCGGVENRVFPKGQIISSLKPSICVDHKLFC